MREKIKADITIDISPFNRNFNAANKPEKN